MKILLFLLLLTLPFQLGKHFWPSFTYLLGLKIDYLSPVVYVQDIIGFFLIAISFKKLTSIRKLPIILSVFGLAVFLNIYFSLNYQTAFWGWFRVLEYLLLGMIIKDNSVYVWKKLSQLVPFWLILEFILGLVQVWKQSSLGGIFWIVGERNFNVLSPGIARAEWLGKVFLRPYGTFSHPNSLAGFVLICLILISGSLKNSVFNKISFICGMILLVLCFSRTVWLTLFLLSLFYVLFRLMEFVKNKIPFNFAYFFFLGILGIVVFLFSKTRIEASSFNFRQELMKYAIEVIKEKPLIGVGLNNFIISLSESQLSWKMISFLQPVHNIFLLTGAEFGLIGLAIFITFIFLTVRRVFQFHPANSGIKFQILIALLAIIFTGLFDHYWLTLVQNQFLFVLVLGLSWSKHSAIIS